MDSPNRYQRLHVEDVDGVTVIRILEPVLDNHSAILGLHKEWLQVVARSDVKNVLLDLSAVRIVSSVMLGKLLQLKEELAKKDGKLVVCNLNRTVHQSFAITKLTKKVEIRQDETDGLAAF